MKRKGGHLDPRVYTKKAFKSNNFFYMGLHLSMIHRQPDFASKNSKGNGLLFSVLNTQIFVNMWMS